jgi:hypothetical protein
MRVPLWREAYADMYQILKPAEKKQKYVPSLGGSRPTSPRTKKS